MTHARYGIRSIPAVLLIFQKCWMVSTINPQRNPMHTNPAIGERIPKNRNDQRTFKPNWMPNHVRAFFTGFFVKPFCHTRYAAIPMRANSVVQTRPNSQLGGARGGFTRPTYHTGILGIVAREPREPIISLERINIRSVT